MYWSGSDDYMCEFFKEKKPKVRMEHECCECEKTIPVGAKYYYFVGKWYDDFRSEYVFQDYKMCFSCDRDWGIVISVFHRNGEKDARIVFMGLREAIRDALECGFLKEDDPLVIRWLGAPESRTEEEVETDIWKIIEADSIRKGLQPVLFES